MGTSGEQFQDIIARRLLDKAEETEGEVKKTSKPQEGDTETKLEPLKPKDLAVPNFVNVEKNLTELGFFTPSTKRIKGAKAKTITFTKTIDGKKIEASATIVPGAIYGLPITSDQDKWFAFASLLKDLQQRQEKIDNPIGFTSAALLDLLRLAKDSGKNYADISEWLDLMASTTIISEGAVYFAGRKKWVKDRFRVIERAVSFGKELPDGRVADKNYIWLSEWQLENINNHHLLPVDFETYRQLENHITKALVPLLQIWLYASREVGYFEKRYNELCQLLNIKQYQYPSKIKEKLGPSLNELKKYDYIADWKIEELSDGTGYKIIFYHGEKFYRDREARLVQKGEKTPRLKLVAENPAPAEQGTVDPLLAELTQRGITEPQAKKLLANLPADQHVIDQLEWGDQLIATAEEGKYRNPAGFYVHLIQQNVTPPDSFESSRKQKLREEAKAAHRQEIEEQAKLELAYDEYRQNTIEQHLTANYTPEQLRAYVAAKKQALKQENKFFDQASDELLTSYAERQVRADLAKQIQLLTIEEFKEKQAQLVSSASTEAITSAGSIAKPSLVSEVSQPSASPAPAEQGMGEIEEPT